MTGDRDFAIQDEPGPAQGEAPPAPKPVVILERRGSGWLRGLIPPALILAAAGLILAYRAQEPDWTGIAPEAGPALPSAAAPPPSVVAGPGPIVARVKSAEPPAPPAEVVAKAAEPAPPEPWAPAQPPRPATEIVPPEPPPLADADPSFVDPPQPDKPVAKQEALDDIRREAARKRAARDEAEDLKLRAAARDQADARRRWAEQAERARRFVEEDRPAFHEQLRRILTAEGAQAAPAIVRLCNEHRASIPPDVREAIKRARIAVASRLGRRDRVELYRKRGMPEVMILDDLAHEEAATVGLRYGPRNMHDALIRASRRLLDIPLPGAAPVAEAAAPPGSAPDRRPR